MLVHVSALGRSHIGTLGEGQAVVVDVVEGQRGPEPMPGKGALGLGWGRRRSQRRMYQAIGWVNDAKLVGITGRIFKNASIVRRRLPRVIGLGM